MKIATSRTRRMAVTLTELLVVLVIISILSTAAMPVYVGVTENARRVTAQMDCYHLAQAEEACGVNHERFVPLQVLNDLAGKDVNGVPLTSTNIDYIGNESAVYATDYSKSNLNGSMINVGALTSNPPDPGTYHMLLNWQGPFINFQNDYYHNNQRMPSTTTTSISNNIYQDYPLDPWGNPYLLYNPRGRHDNGSYSLLSGGTAQADFNGFSTYTGTIGSDWHTDRWAVVSWGPDGVTGNTPTDSGSADDIIYRFGALPTPSTETTSTP
jgi:prepilin-type N-terminal cleavage/methylation domain-containing protein